MKDNSVADRLHTPVSYYFAPENLNNTYLHYVEVLCTDLQFSCTVKNFFWPGEWLLTDYHAFGVLNRSFLFKKHILYYLIKLFINIGRIEIDMRTRCLAKVADFMTIYRISIGRIWIRLVINWVFPKWLSLNSANSVNHDKIQEQYCYHRYYPSGNRYIPSASNTKWIFITTSG